jgi:DNA-3-methyladenine glycosylase II
MVSTRVVNEIDIKHLIKTERIFAKIYLKYGSPPDWNRPQGFISLAKIILGQQVSLESAEAHFKKLNNYVNRFTPHNIIKLSDKEMRYCQISKQKSLYLSSLSSAVIEKNIDLKLLPELTVIDIRNLLKSVKGIGDWTADIYLIFCLQKKDIFPSGDIAVVNTIKELSKAKSHDEIIRLSEKWKPLRSLTAFFLWHYYLSVRKRKYLL